MALGTLILLSFLAEAPAKGVRRESKNLNLVKAIRPTASQPFPLPSQILITNRHPQGICNISPCSLNQDM
jgi:hypothetical protein